MEKLVTVGEPFQTNIANYNAVFGSIASFFPKLTVNLNLFHAPSKSEVEYDWVLHSSASFPTFHAENRLRICQVYQFWMDGGRYTGLDDNRQLLSFGIDPQNYFLVRMN